MATLILQDGTSFTGETFGGAMAAEGEVIFATEMIGYQLLLTDPAYRGQILCLTFPLIGNVGINDEDMVSGAFQIAGLVVQAACDHPSNWRCQETLSAALAAAGIPGLAGVDTRALARHLRSHGTQRGRLCAGEPIQADWASLKRPEVARDLVAEVTCAKPYDFSNEGNQVAVLDLGADKELLTALAQRGGAVRVYPASTPAESILADKPAGVVLSGGPGDPAAQAHLLPKVSQLMQILPTLGIGLGLELMTLAAGGGMQKLPYGHHGGNVPVKDLTTGRCWQTAQRHLYVPDENRLPQGVRITHRNVNDGGIAGLAFGESASGVIFHPSAAGGPGGTGQVWDAFIATLKK